MRLSFGRGTFYRLGGAETSALAQLETAAEEVGLHARYDTAPERFADLLRRLHRQSGQRVVVLVDEYDKPMLDALDAPDVARANRDFRRALYGTVKDCDEHVRFAFVTGVTKFSKVSLFSGLNNLLDITLHLAYATVCGYAEADLDAVFAPALDGLDRDEIRRWYNGYNWWGRGRSNPFDILTVR